MASGDRIVSDMQIYWTFRGENRLSAPVSSPSGASPLGSVFTEFS
jgi:hypothetical protein